MTPRELRALVARERRWSERRAERRGERATARDIAKARALLDAAEKPYGYRGGKKRSPKC